MANNVKAIRFANGTQASYSDLLQKARNRRSDQQARTLYLRFLSPMMPSDARAVVRESARKLAPADANGYGEDWGGVILAVAAASQTGCSVGDAPDKLQDGEIDLRAIQVVEVTA